MGGYGSGRTGGRPIAEHCRRVDLTWMLRRGMAIPGQHRSGVIRWNIGDEPAGSISYDADMVDSDNARLILRYRQGDDDQAKSVEQVIWLEHTRPNYGGKRWWMRCPYAGNRCAILYLPPFGDRFASRKAWKASYKIQRVAKRDVPFEALFKLQRRLGCHEGWQEPISKPKGMWNRTYERYEQRYHELDELCSLEMLTMFNFLNRI